tara:strand:- start:853 stop:2208 length:1356 start_codon:yes stop_codon:yes gene_type:complete
MNQPEFPIRRINLFANSEDRDNDLESNTQYKGGRLQIPLDNLNIRCSDNQYIKLTLQSLTVPNTFDNHLAFDQRSYLYLGENAVPKTADGATPSAVFTHSYLTMPEYRDYTSLMVDATQMVATQWQIAFPPAAWTLAYTQLRGYGESTPSVVAGSFPGPAGNPPLGYSNLGEFRQNGTSCLLGSFTLTQTAPQFYGAASSGVTAPSFNNTALATSFALTSAQSSDIYLLVGGRKSRLSSVDLSSTTSYEANAIIGTSATDTSKQLLNMAVSVASIGGVLYRITVTVSTVLRMQLQVNNLLFLRTNLISSSYATDNYNQREGVQKSTEVSSSNIWGCFPLNSGVIYYENSGGAQWVQSIAQRSIPNIELFLTNKDGITPSIDNPASTTPQDFNLSFQIAFSVEIMERAKVISTIPQRDMEGQMPARFSGPWNVQNFGNSSRVESVFTKQVNM